jgi:hypothetical protein
MGAAVEKYTGEEHHIALRDEHKERLKQRKLLFIDELKKKTSEEAVNDSMEHIEKLFEQPLPETILKTYMRHLRESSEQIKAIDVKELENLLRDHVFLWGPSKE